MVEYVDDKATSRLKTGDVYIPSTSSHYCSIYFTTSREENQPVFHSVEMLLDNVNILKLRKASLGFFEGDSNLTAKMSGVHIYGENQKKNPQKAKTEEKTE